MVTESSLFSQSYHEARSTFINSLQSVQNYWPNAKLNAHKLIGNANQPGEDLSIDWIAADALVNKKRIIIFTTGEHGVEGFVGTAMLQKFIHEFIPIMHPDETGLLLVHAINPWGMKHRRRVNSNNVELNRNFIWKDSDFSAQLTEINPEFGKMHSLLSPQNKVTNYIFQSIKFFIKLIIAYLINNKEGILKATTFGQYSYPQGIYFGGNRYQEETQVMNTLFRTAFSDYDQILHLDMHTGYGPAKQMTIVNSQLESKPSDSLKQQFNYHLMVQNNPEEFYSINGDMIDFVYKLARNDYPGKHLYATTFEFGTLGDSFMNLVQSLQTLVFENQAFFHGASPAAGDIILRNFDKMFFPSDLSWKTKALADFRQATTGILKTEGFI